ncbi:DUF1214 domain-containing protein [Mycolicibacterium parafortuitum]|uniref:DUF1214 domain-containing protein n=1 Tax=Mycolicibacterium parafortuitum TaxID=39692 RepID=A0A375YIP0_MYCPF|nr:DUF1214 domain-containing protein [Mycolicibacterium parafortuitum]SRX80986.1 hypothetical protein [Sphingomonas wittichii RW1] [Mycolicibacterium parafortuitum]
MATRPSQPVGPVATHARFIGRVGALAVGLGIGAAIAQNSAVAAAEDTPGAASSSASETSAGPRKPPRAAVDATRTERSARAGDTAEPADRPATRRSGSTRIKVDTQVDTGVDAEEDLPDAEPDVPVTAPAESRTPAAPVKPPPAQETPAPATSPLATPEQLEAERIAAATVQTWPVRLMKLVLRAGWLAAAQREYSEIGGVDDENRAQLKRAVDEYALGAAFQQQLLNPMQPTVVTQVAPPHTWGGQHVAGSRILYDNPDTVYRFMGVNMTSTYVIHGRFTGEMPADTNFSVLTGLSGITADNLSGRDLVVDEDGSFTITVSDQAPAPGQRNHLQLTADTTLIAARNTLSDWTTQPPMTLSIERLSGPRNSLFSQLGGFAIPGLGPAVTKSPVLTALASALPPMSRTPILLRGAFTAVVMALGLGMESKYIKVATTDPDTGERTAANTLRPPTRNAEFLATQLQSAGYFDLTDDEALVVTITPGNARYFVVPVTNLWTITDDYWDAQTSLNNAQAVANPDGSFTFVLSPTDPGVRNWVSTGGLNRGTVSIRFQDLDLSSPVTPTVTARRVALAELDAVLPPTTPYVTEQQRQELLAIRRAGFGQRFPV